MQNHSTTPCLSRSGDCSFEQRQRISVAAPEPRRFPPITATKALKSPVLTFSAKYPDIASNKAGS
jgi:hypothetical protein